MPEILIPIVAPAVLSFYDSSWYSSAGMTRVNAGGGWPAARIMNRAKSAIAVATVRRSLSVHTRPGQRNDSADNAQQGAGNRHGRR